MKCICATQHHSEDGGRRWVFAHMPKDSSCSPQIGNDVATAFGAYWESF